MKTLFILLCTFSFAAANGQSAMYAEKVKIGEALYHKKDYANSAAAYTQAFAANGNKGTQTDRYNAACSYALAGNIDSSFHYLLGAATKNNYDNYGHLTTDTDLKSLYSDKRWNEVLRIVKDNKAKTEANYIKPVVAILDTVYIEDQQHRKGISELIREKGMQSPEVKERLKAMGEADSINLLKVEKILDEYGWLGFDKVGRMGAMTLFLVVQHSPLKVQQKYLPMMREAVKNKQANPANLALLEDRVALQEGRKQIYGSQLGTDTLTGKNYLFPLEDPYNVDKRRKEVGLGLLADYLRGFDVEWDVKKFADEQDGKKKGL